jgi:hypothetical protein
MHREGEPARRQECDGGSDNFTARDIFEGKLSYGDDGEGIRIRSPIFVLDADCPFTWNAIGELG